MKAIVFLSALLLLSCSSFPVAHSQERLACPILEAGETLDDCPWAGVARQLQSAIESRTDLESTLKTESPEFATRLENEGKLHAAEPGFKSLWGQSINFDEGARAIIIPNEIVDLLLKLAGAPARQDRIVHAGFEHTYGYLLSNLSTPYGYKRARWVRPDIENGFGLPRGSMGPLAENGGLFSNVTYFAGKIAFRGETLALRTLENGRGVSPVVKAFDYASLSLTRLEETIALPSGRTVKLRTDFVPFLNGEFGGNGEVLIYSVKDSEVELPYLISMFPVASSFRNGALNPANLGEGKPIQTRYNAFVPGVTDAGNRFNGTRAIVR